MQTHVFEEPGKRHFSAKSPDRRSRERKELAFSSIRYVVVLGLGTVCRAELVDESGIGVGVLLDGIDRSTRVGDTIEIIYHGKREAGEIRHITEGTKGYHIGIEWRDRDGQ